MVNVDLGPHWQSRTDIIRSVLTSKNDQRGHVGYTHSQISPTQIVANKMWTCVDLLFIPVLLWNDL